MFHEHFGLAAPPFAEAPDVSFFCPLHDQTNLLASLEFAFKRGFGIVKLLGEDGTGKTLISRVLVASLGPGAAIGIVDARAAGQLLRALCQSFGVVPGPDPLDSLRQFINGLNGQLALAVIDEAHRLEDSDLRDLSRIDGLFPDKRKPLQVLLLGQPSLDERLQSPDFQSLNHRILLSLTTREMSEAEAKSYLRHRLASAGAGERAVMAEATLDALARNCGGNHRRANLLAEKALAAAATAGEDLVLPIHLNSAGKTAGALQTASPRTAGRKTLWPWLLAFVAVIGLAILLWPKAPVSPPQAPTPPQLPVKMVEPPKVAAPPAETPKPEPKVEQVAPVVTPEAVVKAHAEPEPKPIETPKANPVSKPKPKAKMNAAPVPSKIAPQAEVPVVPVPSPSPVSVPVSGPVPPASPVPEVDDSLAAKVGSGVYPGQKH